MNNFVLNGVVPSKRDVRDYKLKKGVCMGVNYPEWYTLFAPPVKNQGSKPTCVAHACATIVEAYYEYQLNKRRVFSTEWIYGLRELGYYIGDGMSLRDALTTLQKYGVPFEIDLPGNHNLTDAMKNVQTNREELAPKAYPHRITRYFKVKNESEMRQAITSHGYLLASINVREGDHLESYVWTTDKTKKVTGAHAIAVYGWDRRGWLCQNSWGALWGDGGRFVIPYGFEFNEIWGTEDSMIEEDDLETPYNTKIGKLIAKIFNFVLNLIIKLKGEQK